MRISLYNARVWIVAVIGYLLLIEQQWKLNYYTTSITDETIPSLYDFESKSNAPSEFANTNQNRVKPLSEPKHKKFSKERLYNLRFNFASHNDVQTLFSSYFRFHRQSIEQWELVADDIARKQVGFLSYNGDFASITSYDNLAEELLTFSYTFLLAMMSNRVFLANNDGNHALWTHLIRQPNGLDWLYRPNSTILRTKQHDPSYKESEASFNSDILATADFKTLLDSSTKWHKITLTPNNHTEMKHLVVKNPHYREQMETLFTQTGQLLNSKEAVSEGLEVQLLSRSFLLSKKLEKYIATKYEDIFLDYEVLGVYVESYRDRDLECIQSILDKHNLNRIFLISSDEIRSRYAKKFGDQTLILFEMETPEKIHEKTMGEWWLLGECKVAIAERPGSIFSNSALSRRELFHYNSLFLSKSPLYSLSPCTLYNK